MRAYCIVLCSISCQQATTLALQPGGKSHSAYGQTLLDTFRTCFVQLWHVALLHCVASLKRRRNVSLLLQPLAEVCSILVAASNSVNAAAHLASSTMMHVLHTCARLSNVCTLPDAQLGHSQVVLA
jgi:hypothetical protein